MVTTVRNIRDGTYDRSNPNHVYIGRAMKARGLYPSLYASKWANPYTSRYERDRLSLIAQYERWLRSRPDLLAALPRLKGKTLYCWCSPRACHGDVLAELADRVEGAE